MSRQREIQQAAVYLFAIKGYTATGIRDIGRTVGLNSATLYHYAADKEDLLAEIIRSCLGELMKTARQATAFSDDPAIMLSRLVKAHVGHQILNPYTTFVTDNELRSLTGENYTSLVSMRDDYESLFQRALDRGVRTGEFDIIDVPVTRLALMAMCNGVSVWYRADGRLNIRQLQDRYIDLARRMVGSRAADPSELGEELTIPLLESEPPADYEGTRRSVVKPQPKSSVKPQPKSSPRRVSR